MPPFLSYLPGGKAGTEPPGGGYERVIRAGGYTYRVWVPRVPLVTDNLLDTFIYLYMSEDDAKSKGADGACGFLVGVPFEGRDDYDYAHVYAVTAAHVVFAGATFIRFDRVVGRVGGQEDAVPYDPGAASWKKHWFGRDVAVCSLGMSCDIGPWTYVQLDAVSESVRDLQSWKLGLGCETIMAGRMRDLDGGERNVPSLRFGNVAALPEVQVLNEATKQHERVLLVEGRSRSGFSGAPVFVYNPLLLPHFHPRLLGLNVGHIPERVPVLDSRQRDRDRRALPDPNLYAEAAGAMQLVVPAWALRKCLMQDDLVEQRREAEARFAKARERTGAVLDAPNGKTI